MLGSLPHNVTMPKLQATQLILPRCPHCGVDTPNLTFREKFQPKDHKGHERYWMAYICQRCAGVVVAEAGMFGLDVTQIFPATLEFSSDIPARARAYLTQAADALNSPAGAVMLTASAVDSMLKEKGLKEGSLYARIDKAAADHLITSEMAAWAHEVRLEANDQRHADDAEPLPERADAKRCIDFATGLAQLLFILPARIQRGIQNAKVQPAGAK